MRTDRELLQECVNQLKHIDDIYGFEPLATTTSLIREVQQALNIPLVSGSLLRSKAKEYAKFKHQDEYNDPIYHRDVLETLNDFEAGYKAALKDHNER